MVSKDKSINEARQNLVKRILDDIELGKKSSDDAFKRMEKDMKFAKGEQGPDGGYTANFVLQHIRNKVAALYAKNPKVKAQKKRRMLFQVWDGDSVELNEARAAIQEVEAAVAADEGFAAAPGVQYALATAQILVEDYEKGANQMKQIDRAAQTLEILLAYFLSEPVPKFKKMAKAACRRTVTVGISWCRIGFQRKYEFDDPNDESSLKDSREELRKLQALSAKSDIDGDDPKVEELELMIRGLEEKQTMTREGLTFRWPKPRKIILDHETTAIKGFVGTRWMAEEFVYSPERVEEIFGVKLDDNFSPRNGEGEQVGKDQIGGDNPVYATVYEYYDKSTGLRYFICEGHDDFLIEPGRPSVDIEQFFPYFPLTFNDIEDEERIYPPSDVELLEDMQREYNRVRHGLREHRKANRPGYVNTGQLSDTEVEKLASRPDDEVVIVNVQGLPPGTKVSDVLAATPTLPIDPNLYETRYLFDDTQRVVGVAEANIGGVSKATATESSIAESTRQSGLTSNVEDMDEWLSDIIRACGQVLLAEMSAETVQKIVGRGAFWPELDRETIMSEVFVDIEAGSSGRPNKALELANLEKVMPLLMQLEGVTSKGLAKLTLDRLDDNIDLETIYVEGEPSIMAKNATRSPQGPQGVMGMSNGVMGNNNAPTMRQVGGRPDVANPA